MKLTKAAVLLELYADGRLHSIGERLEVVPGAVHSRIADLKRAGYVIEPEHPGPPDHLSRLVAVPDAPTKYEEQLERAGAWGAAAALKRMRFAGEQPASATHESPASHRQVGPGAAASEVPVGGAAGSGGPSQRSSRGGFERDNEAAPAPPLMGAVQEAVGAEPVTPDPGSAAAASLLHVVDGRRELLEERRGIEDELAALSLSFDDIARRDELERRLREIDELLLGRAA